MHFVAFATIGLQEAAREKYNREKEKYNNILLHVFTYSRVFMKFNYYYNIFLFSSRLISMISLKLLSLYSLWFVTIVAWNQLAFKNVQTSWIMYTR